MVLLADSCEIHRDPVSEWHGLRPHSFDESADDEVEEDIRDELRVTEQPSESNNQRLTLEDEREFYRHVNLWRKDTLILSSIPEITAHPSYLKIIGLGRSVVPLILVELRDRPTYWFAALQALVDDGPVGRFETFQEARTAWLTWGMKRGFLKRLQSGPVQQLHKTTSRKSQTKKPLGLRL